MKILITGGAGFIGSHTVDILKKNSNHEIFVIDNLSTGRKENLPGDVEFYQQDLLNFDKTRRLIKKISPDVIYHLASSVSVSKSAQNPVENANNTIITILNLLNSCEKLAKEGTLKKIILSSSQTAYGEGLYKNPQTGEIIKPFFRKRELINKGILDFFQEGIRLKPIPITEESAQNPVNFYGVSKLAEEKYVLSFCNQYGISGTIFRYFNVYGPRQTTQAMQTGVVSIFIKRIFENKPPLISEDGNQIRDFVYVTDVAKANYLALNEKGINVYNVGHNKLTLLKLANLIINETKSKIKINVTNKCRQIADEGGSFDSRAIFADTTKIRNELGWKPEISLEKGINETITWAVKNKEII